MNELRVKENELLENESLRNELVKRCEVLEKVKALLLIKGTEFATTEQVAEYYEVDKEVIRKVIQRNRDEFNSDGLMNLSGKDTKEKLESDMMSVPNFTNYRGYFEYCNVKFNNSYNLLFPRRAILRVGMLLRDSEIAKEVRTQLLNIEEKAEESVKVLDITEEQRLALNMGIAQANGDMDAYTKAVTEMFAFKNRHIEKLDNTIKEQGVAITNLKTDNHALAVGNLEWSSRNKLNAGIRKLALVTNSSVANTWGELYRNLKYKYGISLKQRGDKPYIKHIKENEWDKVIKEFSSMCEAFGQSASEMIGQIKITPSPTMKEGV